MKNQPFDDEAKNQSHEEKEEYRPVIEWRFGDEHDAVYFSCPVEHVEIGIRGNPDKYQDVLEGLEQGESLCMEIKNARLVLYGPLDQERND